MEKRLTEQYGVYRNLAFRLSRAQQQQNCHQRLGVSFKRLKARHALKTIMLNVISGALVTSVTSTSCDERYKK